MHVARKAVLLLKSQKTDGDTDKYELILQNAGYVAKQVKTLDFEYTNLDLLFELLLNPDDYSGLILSSPRCVAAVSLALKGERIDDRWKLLHNFVVGEATHKTALEKLGLECMGSETGNADNLAEKIIKEKELFQKPFLFPHGNLKTDTLKKHFSEVGLGLKEVLVYQTIVNPNLRRDLSEVTLNFSDIPEYLVFFSPSGIEGFLDAIKDTSVKLDELKLVAIGPVTENRLKERKLEVYGTAYRPTPDDVLLAITKRQ